VVQLFLLLSPSWPKCVAQLVGHPDHWWPRQPSHRQTTSDLPLCCHADQCRCQHQSCQTPLLTVPFLSPTWRAELSVIIIIIIISQTTLLDSDTFTSTINAHTHTHTHTIITPESDTNLGRMCIQTGSLLTYFDIYLQ